MSDRYLRLAEPPQWCIQYPTCSACEVDLDVGSGDGWTCPSCGSTWSIYAGDGDTGTLPDGLHGPVVANDKAWQVAAPHLEPEERDALVARLIGSAS